MSYTALLLLAGLIHSVAQANDAKKIGWVSDQRYFCGGYYSKITPVWTNSDQIIVKWKGPATIAQQGLSTLTGGVTVTGKQWQLRANRAYFTRIDDPMNLDHLQLADDLQFLQPDLQVSAERGDYYFKNKHYSLQNVHYRVLLKKDVLPALIPSSIPKAIVANGHAETIIENDVDIRELTGATYSTCPPDSKPAWQLYGQNIKLNKKTGRGEARHATLKIKEVPILYLPYINFPIDNRRQSGFLLPMAGGSNRSGMYFRAPYYFNLAPNYDFLFTPAIYSARGVEAEGLARYLTERSSGKVDVAVMPFDRRFHEFQQSTQADLNAGKIPETSVSAAQHLIQYDQSRYSASWQHRTLYNPNWSWAVDYRKVSDDYYMKDFGRFDEPALNQLLQQAEVQFRNLNWQVLLRTQAYQTLQPLGDAPVQKQYKRMPQLVINGFYPNQKYGLTYDLRSEAVRFVGFNMGQLEGERVHLEPGVSLPLNRQYGDLVPRLRLALTQYELHFGIPTQQTALRRVLPIFDLHSHVYLDRNTEWLSHAYKQTLEPQLYYLYVPYRNQNELPLFDTAGNIINYDTIFSPNRFSGIDRIGDANQLSLGLMTRLIDDETGLERVRFGVGQIVYFSDRRVTLCQNQSSCLSSDYPGSNDNTRVWSPFSTNLIYRVDDRWQLLSDTTWLLPARELLNMNTGLRYTDSKYGLWNVGYQFVKSGSSLTGLDTPEDDLHLTDVSMVWPFNEQVSLIGRWTQDWSKHHFQNMVYGIQYDSCCFAVRLVAGKTFNLFSDTQEPQYDKEVFLQISLKGLGQVATGTESLLTNIIGFDAKTLR